jgi:hypothetical protein
MASKRLNQLRHLAEKTGGEFEVNFSNVTVLFNALENALEFTTAVRVVFGKTVDVAMDQRGAKERVTLSLG